MMAAQTEESTAPTAVDLDALHTEIQKRLKEVTKFDALLPFMEKTLMLESLKIQISAALVDALKKEKKADTDSTDASIIKPLYDTLTAPKDDDDDLSEHGQNVMQRRKVDDESKSNDVRKPRKNQWLRKGVNEKGAARKAEYEHYDDDDEHAHYNEDDEEDDDYNYPRRNFGRAPRGRSSYGRGASFGSSICYNCNERGHFARECPQKFSAQRTRCYHCGKDGHFARECPQESDESLNEKCFRCGGKGHWARDCDRPATGSNTNRFANDVCNRCGAKGHWARDCDLPYQPPNGQDRKNDRCNRCGEMGHWARDCEQPPNFEDSDD